MGDRKLPANLSRSCRERSALSCLFRYSDAMGALMKRILIAAAMAFGSPAAMADWIPVANSPKGDTFSVDPTTKKRSGEMVRIWGLTTYKAAEVYSGIAFLSLQELFEYDCKDGRDRSLKQIAYSGTDGSGTVVAEVTPKADWRPVSPGSVASIVLGSVCAK